MEINSKIKTTQLIEAFDKNNNTKKFYIKNEDADWIEINEDKYNNILNNKKVGDKNGKQ